MGVGAGPALALIALRRSALDQDAELGVAQELSLEIGTGHIGRVEQGALDLQVASRQADDLTIGVLHRGGLRGCLSASDEVARPGPVHVPVHHGRGKELLHPLFDLHRHRGGDGGPAGGAGVDREVAAGRGSEALVAEGHRVGADGELEAHARVRGVDLAVLVGENGGAVLQSSEELHLRTDEGPGGFDATTVAGGVVVVDVAAGAGGQGQEAREPEGTHCALLAFRRVAGMARCLRPSDQGRFAFKT